MKRKIGGLAALLLTTVTVPALQGQTLYMATGSNGIDGSLYTVSPTTAVATLVGPILIGASPVGMTALAFHPVTGVLYGVTSNDGNSPTAALITINPASGAATLIGDLGAPVGDITFDSGGTLYAWFAGATNSLATVNLSTGLATAVGPSGFVGGGPCANGGNGLSFSGGILYLSPKGVAGALYTVNPATGAAAGGPTMSGAPITSCGALAAMATSNTGTLYAIDTDRAGPTATNALVTINTSTGAITQVGAINLPNDADGLAFQAVSVTVPTVSPWGLAALGLLLAAVGLRLVFRN
jgi:hypothetical protein